MPQVTQLLGGRARFGALTSAESLDREGLGAVRASSVSVNPSPALSEGIPDRDQSQVCLPHLHPGRASVLSP